MRNFFNFFLNIQIDSVVLLREGGNLFHLVDDAELTFVPFVFYVMGNRLVKFNGICIT